MTRIDRDARRATLVKVWRLLRGRRATLSASLALATAATLATLYIPRLIGRAVDCLVGPGQVDFQGARAAGLAIVGFAVFAALAQLVMTLANNRAAFGIARDLRQQAFRKLEELPLSYLDGRRSGDVSARVATDADVFTDGLLLGFSQFFTGIVAIVGVLVLMTTISVPITLVVATLTPLSFGVAGFISKKSYVFFKKQAEARGALAGYAEESSQGLRVAQAFGRGAASEREFAALDESLSCASLKATFYSSLTNPATRFVNGVIYAIVGVLGALAVIDGRMTVGALVTFLAYAEQFAKPFNEISSVMTEFQNALACAARLFELIETPSQKPDAADAVAPPTFEGRVRFDDVSFSYSPERPLIQGFNLDVAPGSLVAIVGPTGCGKTTLVNLLMRFYEVDVGAIYVDGIDSRQITRSALRRGFGMVLQETWLKSGTIRDNLLMGATDVSDDELRRVLKACHLDGFVRRLPAGLDTFVAQGGDEFSQGQRQLLCVARVMARNPNVLVLDEATSSIDARTELNVQSAFNALMKGRTSFVVAHRLSTIRDADVILAMKDGAIVEQGTHDELLARRGFYYELYMSQFPSAQS
ncbi:MAG: ABC transporter ATP-binding protein [Thermoguttaceae bacterium]|nr:ABC transporter ATP-binding protein [Thermoguttaceae bacterium]